MPASNDSPFTDAELTFLRELTRAGTPFIVVGMGAAVLQGADAVTEDLDLWFRTLGDAGIDKAARAAGGVLAVRMNPPALSGRGLDRIDLVILCQGLRSFDEEVADAIDVTIGDFSIWLVRRPRRRTHVGQDTSPLVAQRGFSHHHLREPVVVPGSLAPARPCSWAWTGPPPQSDFSRRIRAAAASPRTARSSPSAATAGVELGRISAGWPAGGTGPTAHPARREAHRGRRGAHRR